MSNRNIEKLKHAHQAFRAGKNGEAAKLVANKTKVVDHGRGLSSKSREAFHGWLDAFKKMSSNIKIINAQYIYAGDWVTARFQVEGTQDGPMDNFPASNKPFLLNVCEVWHFNANGEADEGHNYSDGLGLLIQLGHIQPPS